MAEREGGPALREQACWALGPRWGLCLGRKAGLGPGNGDEALSVSSQEPGGLRVLQGEAGGLFQQETEGVGLEA